MSAAAEAPVPPDQLSRSGRLLVLVRKLIDYGRELAATIRQRAATDPDFTRSCFGTYDVTLILACISRGLHRLPTPAQIAAKVRRQPIGAVVADICRDLGILPSHPLWREVQHAVIMHNGSLVGLVGAIIDRPYLADEQPPTLILPAALRRPTLRFEAPGGTGPP